MGRRPGGQQRERGASGTREWQEGCDSGRPPPEQGIRVRRGTGITNVRLGECKDPPHGREQSVRTEGLGKHRGTHVLRSDRAEELADGHIAHQLVPPPSGPADDRRQYDGDPALEPGKTSAVCQSARITGVRMDDVGSVVVGPAHDVGDWRGPARRPWLRRIAHGAGFDRQWDLTQLPPTLDDEDAPAPRRPDLEPAVPADARSVHSLRMWWLPSAGDE